MLRLYVTLCGFNKQYFTFVVTPIPPFFVSLAGIFYSESQVL